MQKKQKGFTLIEILLVIGIIAVLATVVVVALDPATRFKDARDSRRLSDIQNILSAVQQFIVDNKGILPSGIDATERQIGTETGDCDLSTSVCSVSNSGAGCLNLTTDLARYLKSLPFDPANGSAIKTHYSISADVNNIITVNACDSTDATISSVSR